MSRIRIMHVVHSLGTGGTEAGIRKLLCGLDPAVFEQIVCTVAPGDRGQAGGTRVISLNRDANQAGSLMLPLRKVFAAESPDIVHSRNWGTIEAIPAARLAGVKTVIHSEHGLEAPSLIRQ